MNLLDFGVNENGEYCDLVEYEKQKNDIAEEEYNKWVEEHPNKLIRLADELVCPLDFKTYTDRKEEVEWIADKKIYHYGNMEKDLYIYSLFNGTYWYLVFENLNHILLNKCHIEDIRAVLESKVSICFPACFVPCFDNNGRKITKFAEQDNYQEDIRHIICIKEWKMNKYSTNRINQGKKIKDFYECEFYMKDLTAYFGESNIGEEDERFISNV